MESVYFKKEDEHLLRKLVKKMKVLTDYHDQDEAEGDAKSEREELLKIVGKYNLSKKDLDALVHWRHDHMSSEYAL